jgi:hypothetical protein
MTASYQPARATGVSAQRSDPLSLLESLMAASTDLQDYGQRRMICAGFRDQVRDDPDLLDIITWQWACHHYDQRAGLASSQPAVVSVVTPRAPVSARKRKAMAARRREAQAAAKERAEKTAAAVKMAAVAIAKDAVTTALLDLPQPNGKKLRDCSDQECRTMGAKIGPWLERIANRLQPGQTVGEVLDEAEVRKLYEDPEPAAAASPRMG